MTSKPISLPDPLWKLIHRKVESGEYEDESDYIAKLAEADLSRQKLEAWEMLRSQITKGTDSPLVGPLRPGDTDEIVRRAVDRSRTSGNSQPA